MKKSKLLNSELSYEVAKIGHTQTMVICDCGFPIPPGVKRIDLAVAENIPGFLETLDVLLTEMEVEKIILAEQIKTASPQMEVQILKRFPNAEVEYVKHPEFKNQSKNAECIVRTGEMTLYANVILQSGATF